MRRLLIYLAATKARRLKATNLHFRTQLSAGREFAREPRFYRARAKVFSRETPTFAVAIAEVSSYPKHREQTLLAATSAVNHAN